MTSKKTVVIFILEPHFSFLCHACITWDNSKYVSDCPKRTLLLAFAFPKPECLELVKTDTCI